ncbi:hypothetical protein AGR2A_Lc30001 [Agrobacterium genomosp. 2 str. CFBP 5494]|uniref:Uncharacterized protein n=1 Tax=Agrobacterium genomosp. 2 str. CFBP 5494 TaxID=1183436 RepID=A0A9W5B4G0_9HYPH|nr:hypothetical protein AGR2A_Lc30001 [Agrobacterium genomosp. 2 str. CFBP 5494]
MPIDKTLRGLRKIAVNAQIDRPKEAVGHHSSKRLWFQAALTNTASSRLTGSRSSRSTSAP